MKHTIEVTIDEKGNVTGTVKGVAGRACEGLSAWLDKLGEVTVDEHTADYDKPEPVKYIGWTKRG